VEKIEKNWEKFCNFHKKICKTNGQNKGSEHGNPRKERVVRSNNRGNKCYLKGSEPTIAYTFKLSFVTIWIK